MIMEILGHSAIAVPHRVNGQSVGAPGGLKGEAAGR